MRHEVSRVRSILRREPAAARREFGRRKRERRMTDLGTVNSCPTPSTRFQLVEFFGARATVIAVTTSTTSAAHMVIPNARKN